MRVHTPNPNTHTKCTSLFLSHSLLHPLSLSYFSFFFFTPSMCVYGVADALWYTIQQGCWLLGNRSDIVYDGLRKGICYFHFSLKVTKIYIYFFKEIKNSVVIIWYFKRQCISITTISSPITISISHSFFFLSLNLWLTLTYICSCRFPGRQEPNSFNLSATNMRRITLLLAKEPWIYAKTYSSSVCFTVLFLLPSFVHFVTDTHLDLMNG